MVDAATRLKHLVEELIEAYESARARQDTDAIYRLFLILEGTPGVSRIGSGLVRAAFDPKIHEPIVPLEDEGCVVVEYGWKLDGEILKKAKVRPSVLGA